MTTSSNLKIISIYYSPKFEDIVLISLKKDTITVHADNGVFFTITEENNRPMIKHLSKYYQLLGYFTEEA